MKKIVFVFLALFLCFSCYANGEKETVRVAMNPADQLNLNPYQATDSESVIILQNLYEGLFEYDAKTSQPIPAIAESYSVSQDGLIWTFKLNPGARFSDKTKINAKTFVKSWDFLKQNVLSGNLNSFKSYKAIDAATLEITLDYPVSFLPGLLCQPCMAAINPDNKNQFSGAYTLGKTTENSILLNKNKHYDGKVENDRVEIVLHPNEDSDFFDKEIHWSMAYVNNADEYLISSPLYATTFFYFSAKDGPYSLSSVRKALTQAVPWNAIKSIQQGILVTDSLVPDSGAEAEIRENFVTLLKEAGISDPTELPEIKMGIHRGSQVYVISELIAKLWTKIFGITVSIDTVPLTVYTSNPSENPYDFCIITWIADYMDPMAFLGLFETNSEYNISGYSNPEYDKLINAANLADNAERKQLLLEAEKLLLDDCAVIPLSNALAVNFVREDLIDGWYENPLDIHTFKSISLTDK